jgi:hypothetical protein
MKCKSMRLQVALMLLLSLCLPLGLRAQLSGQEQETARKMMKGTFYLRLDVPLNYVQGAWGLGPEPILEVSPAEHDTSKRFSQLRTGKTGDSRVIWVFFPNDGVRYAKLSFDNDTVKVWMEGVQISDIEMKLDFVQIKTLDDFTRAFNQTFSKVPLQDEHPDWSTEVRSAIAAHKLVLGMTKEQAFDDVGTPLDISTEQENGVKVEIWHPRRDRGNLVVAIGRRVLPNSLGVTGFPSLLKFVDDKLQVIQ